MKKSEQDSDHAWFKERIGAFVVGALEADESERFSAHRTDCPECATRLEKIERTDKAMQDAFAGMQPGGHMDARIIQALRKEDAKRSRFSPFFRNAAAACAALVMCGAMGYVIDGMQRGKFDHKGDTVVMVTELARQKEKLETTPTAPAIPKAGYVFTPTSRAPTDAKSQMTLGFAANADPGKWDSSGRDQFVINNNGTIFQKEGAAIKTPDEMARDFNEKITLGGIGNARTRDVSGKDAINMNDVNDVVVPSDVLAKAELGDHFETIDPDKPDSHTAQGNPDALTFHSVAGKEIAGGGGSDGLRMEDIIGVGGQASPGTGGGWGGGSASYADFTSRNGGGRKLMVKRQHGSEDVEKKTDSSVYYTYQDQQKNAGEGQQAQQGQRFKPTDLNAKKVVEDSEAKRPAAKTDPKSSAGKPVETKADGEQPKNDPAPSPALTAEKAAPRFIIRNGEMEFEVDSFDSAYVQISKIAAEESGLIATTNSEKLANGKVRGSITLRVPPEHLDVLVLKLRALGELKNQRITSQDVSKLYTDTESELRAGRAMEVRLLEMIKTGKGDVSDLLKAEKELGVWREKIEKLEGEIRYYNNLISLSTLTLTLSERDIKTPTSATEQQTVNMGIEIDDVEKAYNDALKAISELKGRVTASELKKYEAGQFGASITCSITPEAAGPLQDRLKQLGRVARLNVEHKQTTLGGTGAPAVKVERKETEFVISIYNLANVAPRLTHHINLAAADPEVAFQAILASIEKAGGRVVTSALNRDKPEQTTANLSFEVKRADVDAVLTAVKSGGEVMQLNRTENPDTNNVTEVKEGFVVQIFAQSQVPPRESAQLQVATLQVAESYRKLADAVLAAKGRVLVSQLDEKDRQNVVGRLEFEIARTEVQAIEKLIGTLGDLNSNAVQRSPDTTSTIDSKKRYDLTLFNAERLAPRETTTLAIELNDVDKAATEIAALAVTANGRTIESHVSKDRSGRVVGKVIIDVPMSKGAETVSAIRGLGTLRMIEASRNSQVPEGQLTRARIDITLANADSIVPDDKGLSTTLRGSISTTVTGLLWSLQLIIVGLCFVGPWALIIWLVVRWYRKSAAKA